MISPLPSHPSRQPLQVARAPPSRPAGHRLSQVGRKLNRRPHCGSATHHGCGCAEVLLALRKRPRPAGTLGAQAAGHFC
jgi:hypothetical protein